MDDLDQLMQVTWVTKERSMASADALEKCLTGSVGSEVPTSSSLYPSAPRDTSSGLAL